MSRTIELIHAGRWRGPLFVLGLGLSGPLADAGGPPAGVEQILPRGAIAAITAPAFVPASRAKIPDGAWVLGIVVEGQAKAYDLNLLNRHEVVNDESGGKPFAAVW